MLKLRRAGKAQRKTITPGWPASSLPGAQHEMVFTPLEILPRWVSSLSRVLMALSMSKSRQPLKFLTGEAQFFEGLPFFSKDSRLRRN